MQLNFVSDLLKKPMWMLFLVSWLFYLIGLFLFSQLVWDTNTYMLDFKGIDFDEFLSGVRRIDMLRYVLSPVWIIGMSAVIWALIRMGLLITGIEFDTSLLIKIIFLGLICISLSFWVKSIGLIVVKGNYSPDDIKNFYPGSIIPFIDTTNMSEIRIKSLAKLICTISVLSFSLHGKLLLIQVLTTSNRLCFFYSLTGWGLLFFDL